MLLISGVTSGTRQSQGQFSLHYTRQFALHLQIYLRAIGFWEWNVSSICVMLNIFLLFNVHYKQNMANFLHIFDISELNVKYKISIFHDHL